MNCDKILFLLLLVSVTCLFIGLVISPFLMLDDNFGNNKLSDTLFIIWIISAIVTVLLIIYFAKFDKYHKAEEQKNTEYIDVTKEDMNNPEYK